jgi:cysteine dioxygenase
MNQTTAPRVDEGSLPKLAPLLEYLKGLTAAADLDVIRGLLEELDLTRSDLEPVCIFKPERYQRNLIGKSPWYELVCLCWASGQRTPIHDHAGSSCAFLVVDGIATETRFNRTPSGLIYAEWTKHHDPGYVCASHEADIHQVANIQPPGKDTVTLHLYSPELIHYNIYKLDTLTACDPEPAKG